ncbi:response regulator [Deinococcus sp. A31D244]|uniref:Transcriptional regulatory protein n=1 Tax=Deinococcus aquaticus TaxID=328692 RepID=A0ABY7V057_9DEIO|nr:response regulator [Deinococcus aquaticus]WDA58547.1 response regulator [Deinococcus aquaticus]
MNPAAAPAPTRVLLVEDDLRVARVNRDLLERDPDVHVVGSAATCAQADALARALTPDLILLDVHLPDGSGLGLLRHWRAQGLTTDVALITAADDEASVRLALAHGAFDYLIKPFTGARLNDLLARHRARHHAEAGRVDQGRLDQGRLDRLLGLGPTLPSLPRGIDPNTLERVAQALRDAPHPVSAEDIGEQVSLSRVTAWRYLEHLVRSGAAQLDHQYGQAGRPAKLYRRSDRPAGQPTDQP